jgi:hypothetical protein
MLFFTDYSKKKKYSNVDYIEDYSNSRLFVDIPKKKTLGSLISVCSQSHATPSKKIGV